MIETYDAQGNMITKSVKKADSPYARKLAFNGYTYLLSKIAPDRYGAEVRETESSSMAKKLLEARTRIQKDIRAMKRAENHTPLNKLLPGQTKDVYKTIEGSENLDNGGDKANDAGSLDNPSAGEGGVGSL